MKVLWLTNFALPPIAKDAGLPKTVNEGWLTGLYEMIKGEKEWKLCQCTVSNAIKRDCSMCTDTIIFYGIAVKEPKKYNGKLKYKFYKILKKERPDIVHIMGTEFPHSYSMYEACKLLRFELRCVVSIQGLISIYEKVLDVGIPEKEKKRRLFWDWLTGDSVRAIQADYRKRGKYEIRLLKSIKNVIGRTFWDYICTEQINPERRYFLCNEILRDSFYNNRWCYEGCEKYTIMLSQATYSVKGFHILLEAISLVKNIYPDVKLLVASNTVYENSMNRPSFLNGDYANFICKLIRKYNLRNKIEFLGALREEDMCKAYMRSNVFVLPSTIENSSNALGEAMILGMPIVSAYVGGLESLMIHREEGYFFPLNEPNLLAGYICDLFGNPSRAIEFGKNAHQHASKTHNKNKNYRDQIECYLKIIS